MAHLPSAAASLISTFGISSLPLTSPQFLTLVPLRFQNIPPRLSPLSWTLLQTEPCASSSEIQTDLCSSHLELFWFAFAPSPSLYEELPVSMMWCVMCSVAQSSPTLCSPMDCIPPGSSVHGIFQARIPEWVAISSSRIFPTQRLTLCLLHLLHWKVNSLPLCHLGSPKATII